MDVKWFKTQLKKSGKTAGDVADHIGRSRSGISNIFAGSQRMTLDWAAAFAEVLNVPLDEVMAHARMLPEKQARQITVGFSESDAEPWRGSGAELRAITETAATLGGGKPGIDTWSVRSDALSLQGILPGDTILVDTLHPGLCKKGDNVLAQVYNWQTGSAETVMRRYEPPALIPVSARPDNHETRIVDNNNVVIKGKIIAAWRRS